MNNKTKKQHYIPQFILRNWSDNKSSIKVFLLRDNQIISNAPINGQAQKAFYYGKDQKIEKLYGSSEDEASVVIKKIQKREELTKEDIRVLKHFIVVQNTRTPGKIQEFTDSITEMSKELLIKSHKFDNWKKEIEAAKIELNNYPFWQLLMYLQSFLLFVDLRFLILESKTTNKFVIGQNPVIITNKFLEEKRWTNSKKGLALKGVTVLLPISPEFVICFYDNESYSIIGEKKYHKLTDEEINNLNMYQFVTTENSIYFKEFNEIYNKFNSVTEEYRNNSKATLKSSPIINNTQIIQMGNKDYPIEPKQEFLAIKEKAWLLPLEYCSLERKGARAAQEYIEKDPKLSELLQID
ncbi:MULTISPECIES: DUF4238 domain-containing protein [unclassified Treponema]|uniref:DUF4238 domain-containing protein n=1 Tax=unclassified Treponema TaxID=2638727 RepID=UPI0020A4900C|nr:MULTISPECIES: DUF4238 domain-containing protein [unclassified Treponema]UTC67896.1 DUF4238 domain-containing protein [Treponema sp. OMZ 789]UTC70617.1 DUF4238 domain-containing protein [Treponema sp. OMZ 790]UTC73330.1 DUF4238 domain-containing protein [Treponema sp. OMZ 791]